MTNTEIAKKLRKAGALIEKGWCKFSLATDSAGAAVKPNSRRAVCFCAKGALTRVGGPGGHYTLLAAFEAAIGWCMVGVWNDTRKDKTVVVKAFERAARMVERRDAK